MRNSNRNSMCGKNFSANNSKYNRKPNDLYETPYSLTRVLLDQIKLQGTILEPACGNGAIVKVLNEYNYNSTAYDIEQDFLQETKHYDTIITNPPFSLAGAFVKKAKQISETFIFLLPISYLQGVKRYNEIYTDKTFPLKSIYVFNRYPMFSNDLREDGKMTCGMITFAWYVFDKNYKGNPEINWLDINNYILRKSDK